MFRLFCSSFSPSSVFFISFGRILVKYLRFEVQDSDWKWASLSGLMYEPKLTSNFAKFVICEVKSWWSSWPALKSRWLNLPHYRPTWMTPQAARDSSFAEGRWTPWPSPHWGHLEDRSYIENWIRYFEKTNSILLWKITSMTAFQNDSLHNWEGKFVETLFKNSLKGLHVQVLTMIIHKINYTSFWRSVKWLLVESETEMSQE